MTPIWIASYPRSGNTFLRTILWHCFGLRSASVYPQDLGEQNALGEVVGHVELSTGEQFKPGEPILVKTHNPPQDRHPTIYIVRDGRAATVSLWHFYNRKHSLRDLIEGHHKFSTWSNHIQTWNPWQHPNALLLHYEAMVDDPESVLKQLSGFLNRPIISKQLPERDQISDVDGKWVRKKSDWRNDLKGEDLAFFYSINQPILEKLGYRCE